MIFSASARSGFMSQRVLRLFTQLWLLFQNYFNVKQSVTSSCLECCCIVVVAVKEHSAMVWSERKRSIHAKNYTSYLSEYFISHSKGSWAVVELMRPAVSTPKDNLSPSFRPEIVSPSPRARQHLRLQSLAVLTCIASPKAPSDNRHHQKMALVVALDRGRITWNYSIRTAPFSRRFIPRQFSLCDLNIVCRLATSLVYLFSKILLAALCWVWM